MTKDVDKSTHEFIVSDWCVVEYGSDLFPDEMQTVVGEMYEKSQSMEILKMVCTRRQNFLSKRSNCENI